MTEGDRLPRSCAGLSLANLGDVSNDDDVYTCEEGGGTFTKGWLDSEAMKRPWETQGVRCGAPGTALVCDNCYRAMIERMQNRRGRDN